MSILEYQGLTVDYADEGEGPPVILVHSGGYNNKQWRALIGDLKDRYRLIAVNLPGIGETSPWRGENFQTMDDQAVVVHALADMLDGPISLIGHSQGGSVAMHAALTHESRIKKLILLEPNSFFLLKRHGRDEAYAEVLTLRDRYDKHSKSGEWDVIAEGFIDYWFGAGAWAGLDDKRRAGVIATLPVSGDSWEACMNDPTSTKAWRGLAERMVIVTSADTTGSIKGIRDVLLENLPGIRHMEVPKGGHIAAVLRPDLVNPMIAEILDGD